MNKTEAAYLNALLRWLLGVDSLVDGTPVAEETARWAAAQLAERACHTMTTGLTKARVETLWDQRQPRPYARPVPLGTMWKLEQSDAREDTPAGWDRIEGGGSAWEETAAGLAAAQCCSSHIAQNGHPLIPAPQFGPGRMLARCCDPNDCGPCCRNCPTCPAVAASRGGE